MEEDVIGMTQLLDGGHRKFYELPNKAHHLPPETEDRPTTDGLFSYIEDNIIGKDKVFSGPFGLRKVVYCDYTASGKSLAFLEDYIRAEVLTNYGNTHTTTTVTSLQTTLFRHEARDIIRHAVNAGEDDAVIFVGSGSTSAIHKLICVLNPTEPPIVFVGPFEHHSNLLPWREIATRVIRIAETDEGLVDIKHLETELKQWQSSGRQLIGCFAAASNVTGILTDTDSITILLHKYGAIALWDYASAAPYVPIDMNPSADGSLACKDAVFISVHKFVGGVQTPGLLIAKKKLFSNTVPANCGGGTVFFVRRKAHRYLHDIEVREEGGTPAIVESIRAGLVFNLKEAAGPDKIVEKEHSLCRKAFEFWAPLDNLVILGSRSVPRLPIFSFLVRHEGSGRFLHYNFVCAVLNDLFGIQARGGCACAGPYAEDLLGINEALAEKFENLLLADSHLDKEFSDRETLRPGFTRLNLAYFLNDKTINFILEAVKMVTEDAWKLLPQYNFNPRTGEWRHINHLVFKDRRWLGLISYKSGTMVYSEPASNAKGPLPADLQDCLLKARKVFSNAATTRVHIGEQTTIFDDYTERMRWFLLPSEALLWLQDPALAVAVTKSMPPVPFEPVVYPKKRSKTTKLSKVESHEEICALVNKMRLQRISSTDLVKMTVQQGGMVECNMCGFFRSTSQEDKVLDTTVPRTGIAPLVEREETDSREGREEDEAASSLSQKTEQEEQEQDHRRDAKSSQAHQWHAPPKNIFKPALEALQKYTMIQDGDHVLVCLSGGKDSLSLVHMIRQYQYYCKTKNNKHKHGDRRDRQKHSYGHETHDSNYRHDSKYKCDQNDTSYRHGPRDSSNKRGPHDSGYKRDPRDSGYKRDRHDSNYRRDTQDSVYRHDPSYMPGPQDSHYRHEPHGSHYEHAPSDQTYRPATLDTSYIHDTRDYYRRGSQHSSGAHRKESASSYSITSGPKLFVAPNYDYKHNGHAFGYARDAHESRYKWVAQASKYTCATSKTPDSGHRHSPHQSSYNHDLQHSGSVHEILDPSYKHTAPGVNYPHHPQHSSYVNDTQDLSHRHDVSHSRNKQVAQGSSDTRDRPTSGMLHRLEDPKNFSERTSYQWDIKRNMHHSGSRKDPPDSSYVHDPHGSSYTHDQQPSSYAHDPEDIPSFNHVDNVQSSTQGPSYKHLRRDSNRRHHHDLTYGGVVTPDSGYKSDRHDMPASSHRQYTHDSNRRHERQKSGNATENEDPRSPEDAPVSEPQDGQDSGYNPDIEDHVYTHNVVDSVYRHIIQDPNCIQDLQVSGYMDDPQDSSQKRDVRKTHHKRTTPKAGCRTGPGERQDNRDKHKFHDSMLRRAIQRLEGNI